MWSYYWRLLRQAPKLGWNAAHRVRTLVGTALLIIAILSNRVLAERLTTTWAGVSPLWALVPIVGFFLHELLKANFANVKEEVAPSIGVVTWDFTFEQAKSACLRVRNLGEDQVRNCKAHLRWISKKDRLAHTEVRGTLISGIPPCYLPWSAGYGGGKELTFQSEAFIDVARIAMPYQGQITIGAASDKILLPEKEKYLLYIEVVAENRPAVIKTYALEVMPLNLYTEYSAYGEFLGTPLPNLMLEEVPEPFTTDLEKRTSYTWHA